MSTLILYTSTYGLTERMAKKLGEQIEDKVECLNLMQNRNVDLTQYDKLIIGASIYMGQIQKEMKQFCEANEAEMIKHPIFIFLCCGIEANVGTYLEHAFPKAIIEHSRVRVSFGGELDLNKMKFLHRTITKMMIKNSEKTGQLLPNPKYEAIEGLAKIINTDII
ncbi:flavodoxin domain-containing protein [Fusibacter ferrireducens]|uniref:Flavodoxin domain-containing protein n=1 Tax=Fusibacter ferrireducens TaxID=2785058 RepID=A0ABR9ZPH3_9FIRM|nr:flavodoxin domain-containing protein [Fusibacter ferrireducens]MBF4692366.1 flavodoxin domain-containing protein [Fusibacter ferrireducens]